MKAPADGARASAPTATIAIASPVRRLIPLPGINMRIGPAGAESRQKARLFAPRPGPLAQLRSPSLEIAALDPVRGELDGATVGDSRVLVAVEPPQELGSGGVQLRIAL